MNTRLFVALGCGLLAGSALLLAGCESEPNLARRTVPERPEYGTEVIPVAPHVNMVNPEPRGGDGGVVVTEAVRGTWTFTCPENVTQIQRRTGTSDQFSLYMGKPQSQDTPFVVITVSRDRNSAAEGTEEYKINNRREYILNGNIAREWTGQMTDGAGFCELVLSRPGVEGQSGDVCRVMAVVKNEAQQKAATEILGSIVWKAEP